MGKSSEACELDFIEVVRLWYDGFPTWFSTFLLSCAHSVWLSVCRMQEDFYPDIVIACSSMWHLYLEKNLTTMRDELSVLRETALLFKKEVSHGCLLV